MANRSYTLAIQERLLELEAALARDEWIEIGTYSAGSEFSREGIRRLVELSRLHWLKNPLIKRGVNIQTYYVFGRGINISANDEALNEVVDAFLNDQSNQAELTSAQARKLRDRELTVDGNLFFALFVHPLTGKVRVGVIPVDEIELIVRDPNNRSRATYYKRVWLQTSFNEDTASFEETRVTRYYRDMRNTSARQRVGDIEIDQECVIYHVKVGGFSSWAFGVPDTYAAIDWAKAYKSFLEDFAKITKALARFAWRQKVDGGARGVQAARTKLNSTLGVDGASLENNPSPVAGAFAIESGNTQLDPIKTSGSTTPASDGKELRLMAGIAMGLPDHIASGDTAQGTLATAKSLDRPTEFQFTDRQELWIGILKTLLEFAIYNAVAAPLGALRGLGSLEQNEYNETVVSFPEELDPTIQVDFPPILEQDTLQSMQALIAGVTLDGKAPSIITDPKWIAREVLIRLGIDDADRLVDQWYPVDQADLVTDPLLAQVNESLQTLIEALRG
jgi:hypothetical protein